MRRNKQIPIRFCVALAACLFGAPVIGADENEKKSAQDLKLLQRQIDIDRQRQAALTLRQIQLKEEMSVLRRQMIESARSTQEREALLSQLETQLATLKNDAAQRRQSLSQQQYQYSRTLSALGRLARSRPETILFTTNRPIDTARSATLLRVAIPRLQDRAQHLSREIEKLAQIQHDIADKVERLHRSDDELTRERARLRELLQRKQALQVQTDAERRRAGARIDALVEKANSLRDLVARLQNAPPPQQEEKADEQQETKAAALSPNGLRTFPAKGRITSPVSGLLVGRYGAAISSGGVSRGIRLQARPSAQVVAPFDGKVAFAGPFRDYGRILIIEHKGGYHTVLAGLERIDARVGQWLLAGEPVGVLSKPDSGKPTIYVELRRDGQPINPMQWINAETERVRG